MDGIFISIDIGISTTKTVGARMPHGDSSHEKIPEFFSKKSCITSDYPMLSLKNGIYDFLRKNNLNPCDVSQIIATGAGSSYIENQFEGVPISKTGEFAANAAYGKAVSAHGRAIVVSMGTGTSYVMVDHDISSHLGGISIGGGTLLGLSRLMLGTGDLEYVLSLAEQGSADMVNLTIGDIIAEPVPGLPPKTTAACFAKAAISKPAAISPCDIAAGIVQLVLENIMQTAVLMARGYSGQNGAVDYEFIMTGNLSKLPRIQHIAKMLNEMRTPETPEIIFSLHEDREYATALGALFNLV